MNILHIAPFNVAGVPITFVKAERKLGFNSRLITLAKNSRGYEEDICLDLPFLNFRGFTNFKRLIGGKSRTEITNHTPQRTALPHKWKSNKLEKLFINIREYFWKSKIEAALKLINIDQFELIQLDGGIGFFRDGTDILELKQKGKKIICCYTGSDLRLRGVIPQIDVISDLNVSVEFDHLSLHPKIHHVFFPFDATKFEQAAADENGKILIGHSPTNRSAKGSDIIIPVVKELEKKYPAKLVLIENLPYKQALELKNKCHI